jgi:C-1 hydroxylase
MSVEVNKDLIRRYIETWNRGDIEELVEFWSPDLVHHTRNDRHGYEATKQIIAQFMSNFEDMRFRIEDMIAEGDKVVTRLRWRATHTGDYLCVPATRKQVECALIGIARVEDGKIVEHWGVTDELHLMQQMGLIPAEFLAAMA